MWIQAWGLIHSMSVTLPDKVDRLLIVELRLERVMRPRRH